MKEWKQEIAEAVRARCDHGPGSVLIGTGCPEWRALFVDIIATMNKALDDLAESVRVQIAGDPAYMIEEFKRSIPTR